MASTEKKTPTKRTTKKAPVNLLVSEDEVPKVELKAGMRFDVVSVAVVDEKLRPSSAVGARLCGGTNTCLAMIDLDIYGNPAS